MDSTVSINIGGTEYQAHVPEPLPTHIKLAPHTINLLGQASQAIGELNSYFNYPLTPNLHRPLLTEEAHSSSRIEGIHAPMIDVLAAQAQQSENTTDSVAEIQSCCDALDLGAAKLDELPISRRLLCDIHRVLMDTPDGRDKAPGEFRQVQNLIAGRDAQGRMVPVHIPPPVPQMEEAMDDLERYINTPNDLPPLISIGLVHYQFETIHPFIDGNGRTGRILILLQMLERGLLTHPIPISTAIYDRRPQYYNNLRMPREGGPFQSWLNFFLLAVAAQAKKSLQQVESLRGLWDRYQAQHAGSRSRARDLLELVLSNPVLTTGRVAREMQISASTASSWLRQLQQMKVIRRLAERRSRGGGHLYVASAVFGVIAPIEQLGLQFEE